MVLYEIYREDGGNGITFVHMLYTECKMPDHFPTNSTVTSGVIFSTRPLDEYYSDLALNKICFWHFITMSQSTKRRWNSGPSTPSSISKKKKYNCKFQDEWKKSHHWFKRK
jgi:hypothetical protein